MRMSIVLRNQERPYIQGAGQPSGQALSGPSAGLVTERRPTCLALSLGLCSVKFRTEAGSVFQGHARHLNEARRSVRTSVTPSKFSNIHPPKLSTTNLVQRRERMR